MTQKITHIGDWVQMRKKAYPAIEDFIDAFYWLQKGNPQPMKDYIAKCDDVKKKIPKLTKPNKEV